MAITINLTQLKRKKRKDGTIPIYIRLTENRKSRYKSTEISVKPSQWNANEQVVRKNHRWHDHLNVDLNKKKREVEDVKEQLYKQDRLTMDGIMAELSDEVDTRSIIQQAKDYKAHLKKENRYWEQRHFTVVINNFDAFISYKNKPDQLDGFTGEWIESFQQFLLNDVKVDSEGLRSGNSNNTVRKKMQRVKGFADWLFEKKEIKTDPFASVKRVKSEKTSGKTKLTFKQIEDIKALDLEKGSDLWHARNYFMYSFYNAGIRFGDLCTLTWGNLIDDRLVYKMNKTGGEKSIRQLEPMKKILSYYQSGNSTDYIFPILEKNFSDPMELRQRISSNNVLVNRRLKEIATKAGIQSNISFHVSRHSFAHFALKKGMDLYSISKALGHSDLKITQDYIKNFDEELLDKSMEDLYGK